MDAALKNQQLGQSPNKNKRHPAGLYLLFATEAWERFSYYGMRAILILYLTTSLLGGGLGIENATALSIYGLFTGAVYFTPMIGGWITDNYIPRRIAITIGGITMALGNFTLFAHQSNVALFIGLGLLIIGNGFFKPNISVIVGDLYAPGDRRKDAAFTIFYMGINLGAFIAPLVIGFLAEDLFVTTVNGTIQYGYKFGFLASAIGMIFGQLLFNLLGKRYLGDIGTKVAKKDSSKSHVSGSDAPLTKKEKNHTIAIVILTCFVIFFWAGFEQAGSSLTLYTNSFVDKSLFGWTIPTAWFASINPLFILIFAPIVSMIWTKLSGTKRGDLSIPVKMGLGMILLGVGFIFTLVAVSITGSEADNIQQQANVMFIVMTYLFHTLGELCLSPIGLSMVSRLAPVKLASLLMGVWMASTGVANILAGQLAVVTETLGYFEVFALIGGLAMGLGLVVILISKKLNALMAD